jgi:RNA polymerase sigma-70 factor (ECF subfamily)
LPVEKVQCRILSLLCVLTSEFLRTRLNLSRTRTRFRNRTLAASVFDVDSLDGRARFYDTVWPHRELVLRAAMIQTGNAADAEDLAQETLLRAFRGIQTFHENTNIRAWLLTILRNARIDRLRTKAGSAHPLSLEELTSEPTGSSGTESADDSAWQHPQDLLAAFSDENVIQALQKLAEELRWTLLLVDVEGIDHADAAKILDVPVGTIKSRVHRGRALLRQALLPLARDLRLVRD